MYFAESAYLLADGVAGQAVVTAVDAFLYEHNRDAVFEEATVARATGCPRMQVRAALDAYVEHGTLRARPSVRCPERACGTLNPAERVAQARADGDEDPCDGPCGGANLASYDTLEEVTAYEIVKTPTP